MTSAPNDVPEIDCLTAVRQLWDYLDQELTEDRMAMVRHHIATCEACLPHHDFGTRFLAALRETREEHLMPPEVKTRVMQLLAAAGYSGTD
jgi:anti-sigma factor (TIGR02949 family)